MRKIREYLQKKTRSDKADSVLVIFLVCVPLLVLVMGFVVDLNKNVNTKIAYNSMAQQSAETAVKQIGPNGRLNQNASKAFVDEYKIQASASDYHTNETQRSETCSTMDVNGVERKMPYMVITLQEGRGSDANVAKSGIWAYEDYKNVSNPGNVKGNYRAITATVYDSSTNAFGTFGLPDCQLHSSEVSAVSFGSNEDVV